MLLDDVAAMFDRLYALTPNEDADGHESPRIVSIDHDAKRCFVEFYSEQSAAQTDRTGAEAAAWSKLEGYAAALTLVIDCARVVCHDAVASEHLIDDCSMRAGITLRPNDPTPTRPDAEA